jgi:hypothetical protein
MDIALLSTALNGLSSVINTVSDLFQGESTIFQTLGDLFTGSSSVAELGGSSAAETEGAVEAL